jgi:hypothetical protein
MEEIRQFWHQAQEFPPLPADYESWGASDKQNFLWERILKSKYDNLPPLQRINVIGLFLTALRLKMERLADEAPSNWHKAIHAHASVAKVKFIPTATTPFTGLFKGADYGLIRLSLTGDPADRGFAPGLALKLFVDGHSSANVSALVSLTGQSNNYHFFANEMSNIVPVVNEFGPRLINLIFSRVTRYPTKLYLQDFGAIEQNGSQENSPYYPYQIFLVPNGNLIFSETPHDFRQDLATISPGTRLFSVEAVDPGKIGDTEAQGDTQSIDQPGYRDKAQLIGYIETTSEFIASYYGDSQLFFRHQRFANK